MGNVIVSVILTISVGAALIYIFVAKKKKGVKCVGCPYSGNCNTQQKCGVEKH